MQVGLVFRSQFRGVALDPEVEHSLTGQPQALGLREYVDTAPGDWLPCPGRGPYGPTRNACTEHLVGRRDFAPRPHGVIGWHPHGRVQGDLPAEVRRDLAGTARKRRQASARNHGRAEPSLGFRG